ncbi:MAG TPA: hypothetical protein ENJ40_00820 [Thermosulfurimonas dismutans]|uniref:UspA domain-containing protein n=1 Tax=Thermosulfurimonas dismutans TaxID=999894 RepID=A0A7C3GZW5_9BACT|nr:hypothetical protein [Thermosulfurimonas dismutans]
MPQRFLPHLAKPMVPLGKDGSSEMLLDFLVCMLREMPPGLVEKIYLVHVVSDDALKKALGRDLRLEALLEESGLLRDLYEKYLQEEARPFLTQAEERLRRDLPEVAVERVILRGHPPRELVLWAHREGIKAEIIARRARSHLAELVLGSCTHALLHRPGEHSTYVVGRLFAEKAHCRDPRFLVCLDGSPYARKALEEAAGLGLLWEPREIVLLYVVEILSVLEKKIRSEQAEAVLAEAEQFLRDLGLRTRILTKRVSGDPAEEIVREAEAGGYDLVFLGRRGMGYLKEVLVGSVSERVIHRVVSPTVVVVNRT